MARTASGWVDDIPPLQILDICIAYESGFGKGLRSSRDINPYDEGSPSWQAYEIGQSEGTRRRVDAAGTKEAKRHADSQKASNTLPS